MVENFGMKTIQDCFGHQVRLTKERLEHIFTHPEMQEMGLQIERVLGEPMFVLAFFMSFTLKQL
jgi:hypothetical protein